MLACAIPIIWIKLIRKMFLPENHLLLLHETDGNEIWQKGKSDTSLEPKLPFCTCKMRGTEAAARLLQA